MDNLKSERDSKDPSTLRRTFSSSVRESQRYDSITKKMNLIFLHDFTILQSMNLWKKRVLIQRAVFRKLCNYCGIQLEDRDKLPDAEIVLNRLKEMIPEGSDLSEKITSITVSLLPENATTGRMKETFTQKMHRIFDINIDNSDLSIIIPYLIPDIFILL